MVVGDRRAIVDLFDRAKHRDLSAFSRLGNSARLILEGGDRKKTSHPGPPPLLLE